MGVRVLSALGRETCSKHNLCTFASTGQPRCVLQQHPATKQSTNLQPIKARRRRRKRENEKEEEEERGRRRRMTRKVLFLHGRGRYVEEKYRF